MLHDTAAEAIVASLEQHTSLRRLDLDLNRIRHELMLAAAQLVRENVRQWKAGAAERFHTDVRFVASGWGEEDPSAGEDMEF